MATDLRAWGRRPRNRKESDHIKGTPCNGCMYMTVLDRHRSSVEMGKLHREYYEEYYCNAKGRIIDPHGVECEGRR